MAFIPKHRLKLGAADGRAHKSSARRRKVSHALLGGSNEKNEWLVASSGPSLVVGLLHSSKSNEGLQRAKKRVAAAHSQGAVQF